ncbi:MAG: hypothetical protein IID32_04890, partial [Planctomycetes bacterium]|nr:hypothetical protein [Planctomycetota bacterium]
MSPKIVPFIFNWKHQFENTKRTERQLQQIFSDVLVINSDPDYTSDNWVDLGDEAYFTQQFFKAIDLFDGDILFHLQADANYHNWETVFSDALHYLDKYNWGVFAPNIDFTGWNSQRVDVKSSFFSEPELRLVSCTDCTCWFIHRDIIRQFVKHKLLFSENKFGWGIDLTIAALSYFDRRPVIRDYSHTIVHPRGRGYDNIAASVEFRLLKEGIDEKLKPV